MSEKSTTDPRRQLPSVNQLIDTVAAHNGGEPLPPRLIAMHARQVLQAARHALSNGQLTAAVTDREQLAAQVHLQLAQSGAVRLRPVINATGIMLHTGLGRAPLADAAIKAMVHAAGNAAVELDLPSGERGHRTDIVRPLLCELTGAASATVVNNCTAALVLTLSTLARHHAVIVSRGELVEIGGSFRLPEIMAAAGVHLREVGTTNRTRADDYARAIDDDVAALLSVHCSNYRVQGFTESASIAELADIAQRAGLPLVHDIGSGALDADAIPGECQHNEPLATQSIRDGSDLCMFSGDKLMGGPQAGIIVGRADLIEKIDRHPLKRAMRVDKFTLAGLAATLELHLDPVRRARELPLFRMAEQSIEQLRARAQQIVSGLAADQRNMAISIEPSQAYLGGGSMPGSELASIAIVLRPHTLSAVNLATRLRTAAHPIVPRVQDDAIWLDLRTINVDDDARIAATLVGMQ